MTTTTDHQPPPLVSASQIRARYAAPGRQRAVLLRMNAVDVEARAARRVAVIERAFVKKGRQIIGDLEITKDQALDRLMVLVTLTCREITAIRSAAAAEAGGWRAAADAVEAALVDAPPPAPLTAPLTLRAIADAVPDGFGFDMPATVVDRRPVVRVVPSRGFAASDVAVAQ